MSTAQSIELLTALLVAITTMAAVLVFVAVSGPLDRANRLNDELLDRDGLL